MAISYNAGTNTITITGYTAGTPCTFLDVYNADVAGGWGKVTKQCVNQYCLNAKLVIGDGSTTTWFVDSAQQILWNDALFTTVIHMITIKTNATAIFGKLLSATDKTCYDGCAFICLETTYSTRMFSNEGGTLHMYSCFISAKYDCWIYHTDRFWNNICAENITINAKTTTDIFNTFSLKGVYGAYLYHAVGDSSNYTLGNLIINNSDMGVVFCRVGQ